MRYIKTVDCTLELTFTENISKDYGFHNHLNHYIVTLVTEGSVLFQCNNTVEVYNKNEFFVIPPYKLHKVTIDKASKAISFCIENQLIEKNDFSKIKNFLQSAYFENYISEHQAEIFRISLGNLMGIPKKELSRNSSKIIENFETVNLDEISKSINVSKYHMIRRFKAEVGLTPHKVHIQKRIRKSQKLLDNKSFKIIDVCLMTGFYDQSHYDKAFKKIVGISPKEYVNSLVKL